MPTATRHCKGAPRNHSKTYKVPRRPFESPRLDAELKLAGEYGLKNKKEIWRIALTLSKIRRAARELLKLDEKDPKRLFEGNAIIRRLIRIGVLDESRMKLDYVLALQIEDFLERRLQFVGNADVIHHQAALLVLEHAVHPGDGLHQVVALHGLVHIQGMHAGRVEAGQPHVAHDD